jgi:hypothetical protein
LAWFSTVLKCSTATPQLGQAYVYNGKLIALLILKLPRWIAVYAFPIVGAAVLWWLGYWFWWLYAVVVGACAFCAVYFDPYEGPIFRFPIATYRRSRPRQSRGTDLHEP